MPNKFLNSCAGGLGVAIAVFGGTILFRGASTKNLIAGSCLYWGGSLLAISRLCQARIEKEIELGIDTILEERRKATPKTCRGCRNFHGIKYGGVTLICGIHPSGVNGDNCPDFEKFSQKGKRQWK